jgi:hypothetical protein
LTVHLTSVAGGAFTSSFNLNVETTARRSPTTHSASSPITR